MRHLLDTGILLRLLNRQADAHESIRAAVRRLKSDGHECVTSLQNVCEFWNVCTRPATGHGVRHLLTLNPSDFSRFARVIAQTPEQVLVTGE